MSKRRADFDQPGSSRRSRISTDSRGSSPYSDRGSSSSRTGLAVTRLWGGASSGTEGDDECDELSASDLFAFDEGVGASTGGKPAGGSQLPAFSSMSLSGSTSNKQQQQHRPPSPSLNVVEPTETSVLEAGHLSSPEPTVRLPLVEPFINPQAPFIYDRQSTNADVPLFKLDQDVLYLVFNACSARSISVLTQSCRHIRDSIARWQGFNAISMVTLDDGTQKEQQGTVNYSFNTTKDSPLFRSVSGSLPPSYPSKGHVKLGNKLYMPHLTEHPSCYVCDLDSFIWTRHWLKVITESVDDPAQQHRADSPSASLVNMFSRSSSSLDLPPAPLPYETASYAQSQSIRASHTTLSVHQRVLGPVAGFLDSDRVAKLFVFGGTRVLPSSSSDSSQPAQTNPPSSLGSSSPEANTSSEFRSEGGTESSDSLYSVDTETWELRDLTRVTTGVGMEDIVSEGDEESSDPKQPMLWPSPRREHSIDVVRGRWLVSLGGLANKDSIGENDVWVCDLDSNVWTRPEVSGRPPAPSFCHASALLNDDIYTFGGSQIDIPTDLTFDSLSRLCCEGDPTGWAWHNYRPSEEYAFSRSRRATRRLKARAAAFASSSEETSSGSAGERRSTSTGQVSSLESTRSHVHSQGRSPSTSRHRQHLSTSPDQTAAMSGVVQEGEASSGTSAEFSGDSVESFGISTTGSTPLERRDATMMVVGTDRLVLIGGMTVEDGHDRHTGAVFDDLCGYNLGMIDIFDTTRKHWSKIRPSPSADQAPVFFLEGVYCSIPPTVDSFLSGWKILAQGKSVDFDDILVNVVDQNQPHAVNDDSEGLTTSGSSSSSSRDEDNADSSGGSGPSMDLDEEDDASEIRARMPSTSSISSTPTVMARCGEGHGGWSSQAPHPISFPLQYALPRLNPDVPLTDFDPTTRRPRPPPLTSAHSSPGLSSLMLPPPPSAPPPPILYPPQEAFQLPSLQPQSFQQPTPLPTLIQAVPVLPPLARFPSSQPLSAFAPSFVPSHLSQIFPPPVVRPAAERHPPSRKSSVPLSAQPAADELPQADWWKEGGGGKEEKQQRENTELIVQPGDNAMEEDESFGTIGIYKRDDCLACVSVHARIRPVQYQNGKAKVPSSVSSDDEDVPVVLHAVPFKIATQLVVFA